MNETTEIVLTEAELCQQMSSFRHDMGKLQNNCY